MTDDELKTIEKLVATHPNRYWSRKNDDERRADDTFIQEMQIRVPALIAEVRRLKTENERLKDESERWMLLAEAREPVE